MIIIAIILAKSKAGQRGLGQVAVPLRRRYRRVGQLPSQDSGQSEEMKYKDRRNLAADMVAVRMASTGFKFILLRCEGAKEWLAELNKPRYVEYSHGNSVNVVFI